MAKLKRMRFSRRDKEYRALLEAIRRVSDVHHRRLESLPIAAPAKNVSSSDPVETVATPEPTKE